MIEKIKSILELIHIRLELFHIHMLLNSLETNKYFTIWLEKQSIKRLTMLVEKGIMTEVYIKEMTAELKKKICQKKKLNTKS